MNQTNNLSDVLSLPQSFEFSSLESLTQLLEVEQKKFETAIALSYDSLQERQVEEIRLRFSGKSSPLQSLLKNLKNIDASQRKEAGAQINQLRDNIYQRTESFVSQFMEYNEEKKLKKETLDLTLPLPKIKYGSRHPVSHVVETMLKAFQKLGFAVVDGPELDSDFFNFEALNFPPDHPAREMQDTLFLSSGWVLRTHTSNVQVHAMLEKKLPLRIVCAGHVYRNECDLTHAPTFRQMECLVIDKNIHMGHLRYTLEMFFKEIFTNDVKLRFRSSFFPFTEPSAEVDVQCQQCMGSGCRTCKQTGWLEMGGCGMVHPNVLKSCNIDPNEWSGFAFGMGIDRIAMMKYKVPDIRSLFEGDVNLYEGFKL